MVCGAHGTLINLGSWNISRTLQNWLWVSLSLSLSPSSCRVRAPREINALAQSSEDTAQWIFDNYIPLGAVYLWCLAKWQWQAPTNQLRDRETKCRTTLICHACGWVHWIYGHCIFEHICYVPCANHTHSTAHRIFGHWTFEWHCVSFCIWWECRCACRYLCINSPFVYGMYTCVCVCMCTGKLLHFNAKMLSIHHSNFNYIIQMGLQRFTKKQQQTFRYIRLHHRRSEIAFAHSMKILIR